MATYNAPQLITPGIAVVTGASSGIGRACSIALAHAGWTVVLSGRKQDQLEQTQQLAQSTYKGQGQLKTIIVAGDLSKKEDVDELFDQVKKQFGRLDLLFNNAGMSSPPVPLHEISYQCIQDILAINVTAPFLCTQHAFQIMSTQSPKGGRIINNGSISAYTPRPMSAPYTLTKHAINGLTKSTALDGRKYNIACSEIDVGNAESKMASAGTGKLQPCGETLAEPVMPVEYVAHSLVHMASLPLDVNILNQTIMATQMPFVGRG